MRVLVTARALLAAVIASGIPVAAHHSTSMFDSSAPIWLKGTFVRMDRINPHAVITMDEMLKDGRIQRWTVEGPSGQGLRRLGFEEDVLIAGQIIEVCGFSLKAQFSKPTSPVADGAKFVHGQMLVMPDGQMRIWGAYGTLENCVRPGDQVDSWLTFVNTDSRARQVWCNNKQLSFIPSPPFAKRLVDDIDRQMTPPCH